MASEEAKKRDRGKRIKLLRGYTYLSRRAFGIKHNIPVGTLQYWEDGRFGGLSEEGARKIITALAKEGIWVSMEWLLYGQGSEPVLDRDRYARQHALKAEKVFIEQMSKEHYSAEQELTLFSHLHPHAIHEILPDDSMQPRFQKDEYVAGIPYFGKDLRPLIGKDCIVRLKNNQTLIRRLHPTKNLNEYYLVSLNPFQQQRILVHEIQTIANIIWVRSDIDI